jgi:hypothetical protein
MRLLRVCTIALVFAATAALPASAAHFYVGASWLSTDAEFETAVDTFDTDDSGWKVFGGVDFMGSWASR